VALWGATPVFVDVDERSFNIDPASLENGIALARKRGLTPRAVIPVDLFGQSADHDAIKEIAAAEGLFVLDDAAQSFGASYKGRRLGRFGLATTTSFFPAKPFGCYGDGGAIFTDDDELASVLRSIRVHGQGSHKYDNVRLGMTARLDTIQAAILSEKLKVFDDEIARREAIAQRYHNALGNIVTVPHVVDGNTSVWAQYTVQLPDTVKRDDIIASLKAVGVPTMVYYERPMHRQPAYRNFPVLEEGLVVSDRLARRVVSLPMHPYLDSATQDRIVDSVRRAIRA
jgi:dTDP-4-amino-4,6-dideoxygalactose transaminase